MKLTCRVFEVSTTISLGGEGYASYDFWAIVSRLPRQIENVVESVEPLVFRHKESFFYFGYERVSLSLPEAKITLAYISSSSSSAGTPRRPVDPQGIGGMQGRCRSWLVVRYIYQQF